jgi:hypothetical protein
MRRAPVNVARQERTVATRGEGSCATGVAKLSMAPIRSGAPPEGAEPIRKSAELHTKTSCTPEESLDTEAGRVPEILWLIRHPQLALLFGRDRG